MIDLIRRFAGDESGATAIEYGLLGALIAVVILGVVQSIGTKMSTAFTTISAKLL